jgi:hypothetical protein
MVNGKRACRQEKNGKIRFDFIGLKQPLGERWHGLNPVAHFLGGERWTFSTTPSRPACGKNPR